MKWVEMSYNKYNNEDDIFRIKELYNDNIDCNKYIDNELEVIKLVINK